MEAGMFFVDIAVKASVVLLAALVATRAMRRLSAAARHAIWGVALAAILVMPAFSLLIPAWRVLPAWTRGIPVVRTAAIPPGIPVGLAAVRAVANSHEVDAPRAPVKAVQTATGHEQASEVPDARGETIAPISQRTDWHLPIVPLYFAGAFAALLPIFGSVLALFRAERRARTISDGRWAGLMEEIRKGFSIRREIVLLQSESGSAMPMTWGLRRPRVLVPASADDWSAERRRVVLLHEAAHVKRGDWLTHLLCQIACCVYWFHPLAWYAAAQVRLEAEHACDDAVMAVGAGCGRAAVKPSAYASELLTLAGSLCAPRVQCAGAIAMARGEGGQLQARIRAILDSARNRRGFSARGFALAVILTMAAVVPLSALRAAAPIEMGTDNAAEDFTHDAHFELGESQFLTGDHITITEIRGTSDKITPQNSYQIKGTYTLASADDADLAVYVTSAEFNDTHHDPYDQRQTVRVKKGSGNFTVVLPFLSKGFPHLSYYPTNGGSSFSAQYFGTGETVWNAENEAKVNTPSVLVVVSPTGISFEGKPTTWEDLPGQLENVPDRAKTILKFALTTDEMTVRIRNDAFYKLAKFSKDYGFRYLSDVGIRPELAANTASTAAMSGSVTIESRNGAVEMDNGSTKIEADKITITLPPEDMWDPTHFQPVVVKTVPESGDLNVPSSTTELKVTFSKDMMSGSYSWCQFGDESFPKTTGKAHYVDARTCVLPVKLEPHHHYVIGLNSPPFSNFIDVERRPAGYYVLAFDTGD